jgi:RHS repeat-associated protein
MTLGSTPRRFSLNPRFGAGPSHMSQIEIDQITGKTYCDYNSPHPTPWVSYSYNKGWLTAVSAGTVYQYTGFDGLGRVTNSSQTTNGTPYTFQYTYNLAGSITSTTLPSGRVINTTYDSAGRPYTVKSTPLGGTQTTYVSSASYATHGALSQIAMGNGITETTSFNARLQPVSIQAGNLLTLGYTYSPTQNNGNAQNQTITRPGVGYWTQTYGYDGVDRLGSANESGTGSWSENYGYDLVGNRWVASRSGLPALTNETPQGQGWYLSNNQISGWGYDGAGNVTTIAGVSRAYTYDAENRLIIGTVNGSTANYSYDGDGRRVQKVTPSATTTYVYDAVGQLAGEYSNAASDAGTEYVTADHLGSTRLVTDGNGATTKCFDYLPYGEEIPNGYAGRTASCFGPMPTYPASPDILSQKFTSKERDAETGLDNFGARYFSSGEGRWTTPDGVNVTNSRLLTPSNTLNKYAYAANNPLRNIDVDGNDITLFARDDLIGGHAILVALNQNTGAVAQLDFVPSRFSIIDALTNRAIPGENFWYINADRLREMSSVTIQTTPEQAQKVIDYINKFNGNHHTWRFWSTNCSTACSEALHVLGIEGSSNPLGLLLTLYLQYSKRALEINSMANGPVKWAAQASFGDPHSWPHFHQGEEYGNPRFQGIDYLLLLQTLSQTQNIAPLKACVTTIGSDAKLDTTCSN